MDLTNKLYHREGDLVLLSSSNNHVCGLVGYVIKRTHNGVWLSNREVKNENGSRTKIKNSIFDIESEVSNYFTKLRKWDSCEILKESVWEGNFCYIASLNKEFNVGEFKYRDGIDLVRKSAFRDIGKTSKFEGEIGDLVLFHGYRREYSSFRYNVVGFIKKIKGGTVRLSNKTFNEYDKHTGKIRKTLKELLANESILDIDCGYWDKFEILMRKNKGKKENLPARLKDIYGVDLLDEHHDPIRLGEYYQPYLARKLKYFTVLKNIYFTFQGTKEVMVKHIDEGGICELPLRTTEIKDENIANSDPIDCKTLIPLKPEEIKSICDRVQSECDGLQKLALKAKEFLELGTLPQPNE